MLLKIVWEGLGYFLRKHGEKKCLPLLSVCERWVSRVTIIPFSLNGMAFENLTEKHMKKIGLIFLLSLAFQTSPAQVMPPDSSSPRLNSAKSRREGIHTSGATRSDKQIPKEPVIFSPAAGDASNKNKRKRKTSKRVVTPATDSVQHKMD